MTLHVKELNEPKHFRTHPPALFESKMKSYKDKIRHCLFVVVVIVTDILLLLNSRWYVTGIYMTSYVKKLRLFYFRRIKGYISSTGI